jgi:hypothetical protein
MAAGPDLAGEPSPSADAGLERGPGLRRTLAYALLLFECVVILVPSVYGRLAPKLFGIPFFYWFQLLWIVVGMFVTGIAYLLVARAETRATHAAHSGRGGGGR